jgi:hypothetical protein
VSKQCHFYSTRDDLLAVTERVERSLPIKYIRFGHVTELPPETFKSAAQIPNLGAATHESAVGCEKFLVADSLLAIRSRQLNTLAGVNRFTIDQLHNPNTVVLNPGGLWKGEILLHGNVAAAHNTEVSSSLMKLFRSAIKSEFKRVRAFWVGPQALEMLKCGKRLTLAEQSPREYDLKVEA